MVYGEVDTLLIVNITTRVLLFWNSLIMCEEKIRCNTISSILCRVLLKLHVLDVYNLQ